METLYRPIGTAVIFAQIIHSYLRDFMKVKLIQTFLPFQSESCDSGEWGWAGLEEAGLGGPKVPGIVSACLSHLRRHGMHTLGLFRVSASKKRVRQVRDGKEGSLSWKVVHDTVFWKLTKHTCKICFKVGELKSELIF